MINYKEKIFELTKDVRNLSYEIFTIFYIDNYGNIIPSRRIVGDKYNTKSPPLAEIIYTAREFNSRKMVMFHNHPNTKENRKVRPSDDDERTTEIIMNYTKLYGIELVDHIIVSKSSYFSFRENAEKMKNRLTIKSFFKNLFK